MSNFWSWLLSHLEILRHLSKVNKMQIDFRYRQRTQEEQLADAHQRVEFLRNQTILRGEELK